MERERILNTEGGHQKGKVPARNLLSDEISRDLKNLGFKFVGPTIIYAYMQSVGLVNDHLTSCFCYERETSE